MRVGGAQRRSVPDDLEPLDALHGSTGAVLCAEVERGVLRHLALFQRCEFGARVFAEEDVVVAELGPHGAGGKGGDMGRQATRLSGLPGHGISGGASQHSLAQGARIAVEQDRVGRHLSGIGLDPGHAPTRGEEAADRRGIPKNGAPCDGECLDRTSEGFHSAFNRPDATGLGLPDQCKQGRRRPGRAADIGGVAGKELCQFRFALSTKKTFVFNQN